MNAFEAVLRLFKAGHMSIIDVKAQLLKEFTGPRSQHDAMLLADFVEDVAFNVRSGRVSVPDAVNDLVDIWAAECGMQSLPHTLH